MDLRKEPITSGAAIIDGFRIDGRFTPAEALPSYYQSTFLAVNGNQGSQFQFGWQYDFNAELISVIGNGGNLGNVSCTSILSSGQSVTVFNSDFGRPLLPYRFNGVIIPGNSIVGFSFDQKVEWCRLIVRPIVLETIGSVVLVP